MSKLDKSTALALLRQMMVIRDFEETADKLCLRGKVPGGMHNSSGQEAVAVGTLSAIAKMTLSPQRIDLITTLLQKVILRNLLWRSCLLNQLEFHMDAVDQCT